MAHERYTQQTDDRRICDSKDPNVTIIVTFKYKRQQELIMEMRYPNVT